MEREDKIKEKNESANNSANSIKTSKKDRKKAVAEADGSASGSELETAPLSPTSLRGETFLSKIMLGILVSLKSEGNRKLPLEDLDYTRSCLHILNRPNGSRLEAQEYAPAIFANIRHLNESAWTMPESALKSEGSSGKSGSFFIASVDERKSYFVKSIEPREKKGLLAMLKDYHEHLQKYPNSTLMKIYGFWKFKNLGGGSKYFIMFNNLFAATVSIDEKFDLKGSTKDRNATVTELAKKVPVLLDNDFMERKKEIKISESARKEIVEQIHKDAKLLEKYHLMDYSLLIGVHRISAADDRHPTESKSGKVVLNSPLVKRVIQVESPSIAPKSSKADKENEKDKEKGKKKEAKVKESDSKGRTNTDEPFEDGREIYFIGIIDMLTVYDFGKKVAHSAKSIAYKSEELSTVDGTFYAERFVKFAEEKVFKPASD